MKKLNAMAIVLVALIGFSTLSQTAAADSKSAAAAKSVSKPVLPTSFEFKPYVFNGDPLKGKDPFYPQSLRGTNIVIPPPTNSPPTNITVVKPVLLSSSLTLKGILGSKNKRLAMIASPTDSYEFLNASPVSVPTAKGPVKVHCVEFKRNSVIIAVEGEEKPVELELSDK